MSLFIWGGALGIAFFSLISAYITASAVAIGVSESILMSLAFLGIFLLLVGMQVLGALATKLDVDYGKGVAFLLLLGVVFGITIMSYFTF